MIEPSLDFVDTAAAVVQTQTLVEPCADPVEAGQKNSRHRLTHGRLLRACRQPGRDNLPAHMQITSSSQIAPEARNGTTIAAVLRKNVAELVALEATCFPAGGARAAFDPEKAVLRLPKMPKYTGHGH